MAGFSTISIPTTPEGDLDVDFLRKVVSPKTAGLMMTNPNTLGLFSPHILEIAEIIHAAGALLYYDGANLNAIMNMAKPGAMGFDVMHLNLHKTFSTPHGGGGPGAGPVLCNSRLKPFLPVPRVVKDSDGYRMIWHDPKSIGRVSSFHGNFAIYLRWRTSFSSCGVRLILSVKVVPSVQLSRYCDWQRLSMIGDNTKCRTYPGLENRETWATRSEAVTRGTHSFEPRE